VKRVCVLLLIVVVVAAALVLIGRLHAPARTNAPAVAPAASASRPDLRTLLLGGQPIATAGPRPRLSTSRLRAALDEWTYPGALDVTDQFLTGPFAAAAGRRNVRIVAVGATPGDIWRYYTGKLHEDSRYRKLDAKIAASLTMDKPVNGVMEFPSPERVPLPVPHPLYMVSLRIVHQPPSTSTYIAIAIKG